MRSGSGKAVILRAPDLIRDSTGPAPAATPLPSRHALPDPVGCAQGTAAMLTGEYNQALVLVSILVAISASYTTLALADRVSSADKVAARWWIAGGAFAMGTGIWSMHFIGMLAFRLPIPIGFDLPTTLASWVLPVAVSSLALSLLTRPNLTRADLVLSALLIGIGINAMHYLGMAAMQMQPGIVWNWGTGRRLGGHRRRREITDCP